MSQVQAQTDPTGIHALDDVVWNALVAAQRRFAVGDDRAMRFLPTVGPFGAIAGSSPECFAALHSLIDAQGPVTLVTTDDVVPPAGFSILRRDALLQMIWQGTLDRKDELLHVRLTGRDVPEMLALTTATKPGPFGPRTIELGSYFGVRRWGLSTGG